MINKLKHRFILIAMSSITIVLLILLGSINIINYLNVNKTTSERLSLIADNNGSITDMRKDFNKDFIPPEHFDDTEEVPFKKPDFPKKEMSVEAPFDIRFFTVTIDSNGNLVDSNTESIAAIDAKEASAYALQLWNKEKSKGYLNSYKYMLLSDVNDTNNSMYIFLDCQRELDTFKNFLIASIIISIIGLLFVLLLVIIFSGFVIRPIAESYEKQKRFITDASHELKTPLTIIDANTEVLEMMQGENEWTLSIRNQVHRLTDLTNKLVFLSRMDEQAQPLTMLDFSLSDAVFETAEPFLSVAQAQGKTLSLNIAPKLSYHGDEAMIRQAVSLLLDNATKYALKESTIELCLSASGKNRILTIKNKASNLSVGNLDMLFERFYRLDQSRNASTGGHGIGLSVVKAIVLAHNAKVTASSCDGKTIEFKIVL